jgi:hypothetical protein
MKAGTVTPAAFVRAVMPIFNSLEDIRVHCGRLLVPEGASGFASFKTRARASLQRDEILDELRLVKEDAKRAYLDLTSGERYC